MVAFRPRPCPPCCWPRTSAWVTQVSSRASFRTFLSFRRALPLKSAETDARIVPCSLLHEYRTGEGTRALQSRFPSCECWPWQTANLWLSRGQNFSPASRPGFFSFIKSQSQHARHRSTSCDLPYLRFHRVLDLHPTSNGRPAVFARYDGLTSQIIGNVEPTTAFSAFEASVRISYFGQRSCGAFATHLLGTLSRAARSQIRRMIGIGMPISHRSNPRPMGSSFASV
jgi:hypothetical protein